MLPVTLKKGLRYMTVFRLIETPLADHSQHPQMPFVSRCLEAAKLPLGWLFANGQTMRWVTEQLIIREMLESSDFGEFFNSVRSGTSLDLGCGGGRYLFNFLVPRSKSVVGIEYNDSHVRLARFRAAGAGFSSRVRICRASAEELPLRDSSIDFVLGFWSTCGVQEGELKRSHGRSAWGTWNLVHPDATPPLPNPEHLHNYFAAQA